LIVAFAEALDDAELDVLELDALEDVELVAVFESDEHAAAIKKPVETRIRASTRRMLPPQGSR